MASRFASSRKNFIIFLPSKLLNTCTFSIPSSSTRRKCCAMNKIIVNFIALAWLIVRKYLTTLESVYLFYPQLDVDKTPATTWNLLPKIFYVQCKVYVDGGFTFSELFRFRKGRTYQRIYPPSLGVCSFIKFSIFEAVPVGIGKKENRLKLALKRIYERILFYLC